MAWVIVEDGAVVREFNRPTAFTYKDLQYPSNWIQNATDAERDDKGKQEFIADFKINADKTLVYQSNSLRQGESAPDRLQVIAAILLANSRICFSSDSFNSAIEVESTASISHNRHRTAA